MKKTMLRCLLTVLTIGAFAGCSHSTPPKPKTFVLVHGAWQAPYVWNTVRDELIKAGQKVIVVELPAHGDDTTSPVSVSMDIYRDVVIKAVNTAHEKVILVGHSMGGVVVTEVAEKIPQQIEKLIYIGAFVPANGQSLLDLSMLDKQSLLGPNIIPSEDRLTLGIKKESIVNIFCQDASPVVQDLVLRNFRVEPAIPFANKVSLSASHYGTVDKYYIHTLLDHAIGIDLQNRMVAAAHITKVYSVNTGHSPFLSQPDQVTSIFLRIIQ